MMLALYTYAYLQAFFVLFVFVMAAKAKWATMPVVAKCACVVPALLGFIMDLVFYWVARALLFDRGRYPGEWTFSQLLGRYKFNETRFSPVACWLCANLLDIFEVGGHCRQEAE